MADDTAYVQALIDAAWQSGGIVQLDARDYLIGGGLVLPDGYTRPLTIRGAGRTYNDGPYADCKGGTRLICATPGTTAISYAGALGPKRPTFVFEDLTVLGSGTKTNPGNGSGIRINGGTAVPIVLIKNVMVGWFYGGAGVWLSNCEGCNLTNVHTMYCDIGFRGDTAYNNNAHVNLAAELCHSYGILIEQGRALAVVAPLLQSNEQTGMALRNVRACHIAAPHYENNNRLNQPDAWGVLVEGPMTQGVAIEQPHTVFPRDRIMVRNDVKSMRIVGGLCGATYPAITLGPNVIGTRIDEAAPPALIQVAGAVGTRVTWAGTEALV